MEIELETLQCEGHALTTRHAGQAAFGLLSVIFHQRHVAALLIPWGCYTHGLGVFMDLMVEWCRMMLTKVSDMSN